MPTLVNGLAADSVMSADRGLQYGDGLFETIAVLHGSPLLWQAHLQRLEKGAQVLGFPPVDSKALASEVCHLAAGAKQAVIKILLTAGAGGRGYARDSQTACTRIVSLHSFPSHPASRWYEGVNVHICETRLSLQPRLAGIKHCNRLEQVLARREWSTSSIAEGLMLDTRGFVAEGTMSNLFAVLRGRLITPSLTECGVHGVMRNTILDIAPALGFSVEYQDAPLEYWMDAEELFLTNSIIGLWPICKVGHRRLGSSSVCQILQQQLVSSTAACMPPMIQDEESPD